MVPRASIGVHLFIAERVIGPQSKSGLGLKQAHAVDFAFRFGDMFFEPPAQATVKIQLPFHDVFAFRPALAGVGVVARAIEQRPVEVHGIRVGRQITGV